MNIERVVKRYQKSMRTIGSTVNHLIKEAAETDIKRELFSTLQFVVHRKQTTNTEIARHFEVGKSTVTAQINRLSDLGLVEKSGSTKDRRTVYIAPTASGTRLADDIEYRIRDTVEKKLNSVDPAEVEHFISQLETLAELLKK